MTRTLLRSLERTIVAAVASAAFVSLGGVPVRAAGTPAGTVIQNTASASYNDGNGNTYTTNSNTVSTTVQPVPSLTVTPNDASNPGQTVGSGASVSDPFTLTNTGNSPGNFTVTTDATPTNGTLVGYVYNNQATGTCSYATPCPLGATTNPAAGTLNALLAGLPATPVGETVPVEVVFTAGQTPGTTTTQTLTATITTTVGGTTTSPAASGTEIDAIASQPRLDLSKTIGTFTGTNPIPFTIVANNGGGFAAHDLTSAEAIIDSTTNTNTTTPGILITDKIPLDTGTGLPLAIATGSQSVALAGASPGAVATLYYTTSTDGSTGWTKTFVPGTAYRFIAAYLTGGTGNVELPSDPTGSSAGGGVNGTTGVPNVTTAQVTLHFSLAQPSGAGAGVSNIANSVIGGNSNNVGSTPTTPVIGPGIPPPGTAGAVLDSPTQSLTVPLNNTSPSYDTTTPPGGASNVITTNAIISSVFNGPLGNANVGATGLYPAAPSGATASNNNDFTAVGATCTGQRPTPTTPTCTVGTTPIVVPGTFENAGNTSDTFGATVTAPAGFTAQVFAATCTTGQTTGVNTALAGVACVQGAALTSISPSGGSVSSTTAQDLTVAAGAYQTYEVVYTPTATTDPAFAPLDSTVTIAGLGGTGTGAAANSTHVDIYPGGPIQLNKTTATQCPPATTFTTATASATTAAPGCTIQYVIAYANLAPAASYTGGAQAGSEPAFALAGLNVPATTNFTLTEDGGTATTPGVNAANWYEYSGGLLAAPTTTGTPTFAFTYYTGGTATSTTTFPATNPSNVSKFTAVSTSGVAPGVSGTITFQVTIK